VYVLTCFAEVVAGAREGGYPVAETESQPRYRSYLLRIWRVNDVQEDEWRASLEDVQTHQRMGFSTLEDLCEFLQRFADSAKQDTQTVEAPKPT
jgi:hypothetical protein